MKNTDPSKTRKLFLFLKRFSMSIAIIFFITLLQMYWSMGGLSDHISSGCLTCSFFKEVVLMSFFTSVFLSLIFTLFYSVKKTFIKTIAELLLLILFWFFMNYSIFVDRESAWSTYDFESEIHYVISQSLFPVLLLGCTCLLLLHYKEIKTRFIPYKR
ncbi:hypothetical protein OK18_12795 [Chryseobacterium gallinarum]|uniref:Uncharacterized protein n=1 Tax=Chryseobacterium gallinarum TaxID=1324352 RepID=A0A0G3M396_CHRGL|nr:hypothetical protein OK18_12795 [Chryseobacterium gallinarum]